MALSFEKPYVWRQFTHVLRGFDGQLTLAVGLLAVAGLITMFGSGYASGTRFWDHARNLALAFCIMFVVAQIPPQRLMTLSPRGRGPSTTRAASAATRPPSWSQASLQEETSSPHSP